MQLRLNDPALIPDLRQHFERSGFVTDRVDAETIDVRQSEPATTEHEREAVGSHLAIWRAVHEDVAVELLD
jgi:hypothetical protein